MYIIIAILAFGLLIAIHEFGHFVAAKLCRVQVNEFSIGMGPAIFKKQAGETLYSLRWLPIGGYCAMEGEDGDEEGKVNPRSFAVKPAWQKMIILVAGAAMNFLVGFVIVAVIYSSAAGFVTNQVVETVEGFKYAENGIEPGDVIYSIDGHRVFYSSDFYTYMGRAGATVDMVVIRDGEKVELKDYGLKPEDPDGYRYGVSFGTVEATLWQKLRYSGYTSWNFVRIVWMGLSDLVRGVIGIDEMSGVVGIVGAINDIGNEVEEQTQSVGAAIQEVMYLVAFIAVNLAVMNLLPIPALDGGRLLFVVINAFSALIFKKTIDPKYEGYVHAAGMVVLLGFMAYVMVSDILKFI